MALGWSLVKCSWCRKSPAWSSEANPKEKALDEGPGAAQAGLDPHPAGGTGCSGLVIPKLFPSPRDSPWPGHCPEDQWHPLAPTHSPAWPSSSAVPLKQRVKDVPKELLEVLLGSASISEQVTAGPVPSAELGQLQFCSWFWDPPELSQPEPVNNSRQNSCWVQCPALSAGRAGSGDHCCSMSNI